VRRHALEFLTAIRDLGHAHQVLPSRAREPLINPRTPF
jgi:hypothetical protein